MKLFNRLLIFSVSHPSAVGSLLTYFLLAIFGICCPKLIHMITLFVT